MWRALTLAFVLVGFSATSAQGPEVASVMHEKLDHAQKILAAVVTSNWSQLETESRQLAQLVNDPRWTALKYPEFAKHSLAFVKAVNALHTAAAQRDLDKTPQAYVEVTLQCVSCHRYLARSRIAE